MGASGTVAKARLSSGAGNRPMWILGINAGELKGSPGQAEIEPGFLRAGAMALVWGRVSHANYPTPDFQSYVALDDNHLFQPEEIAIGRTFRPIGAIVTG